MGNLFCGQCQENCPHLGFRDTAAYAVYLTLQISVSLQTAGRSYPDSAWVHAGVSCRPLQNQVPALLVFSPHTETTEASAKSQQGHLRRNQTFCLAFNFSSNHTCPSPLTIRCPSCWKHTVYRSAGGVPFPGRPQEPFLSALR